MTNEEFMESMKRTWKRQPLESDGWKLGQKDNLTHAVMGSFPQKPMEEELGDVLYYVFAVCHELGVKPEDIMWQNRNKLRERYATTSKLPPNCS